MRLGMGREVIITLVVYIHCSMRYNSLCNSKCYCICHRILYIVLRLSSVLTLEMFSSKFKAPNLSVKHEHLTSHVWSFPSYSTCY